MNDFKNMKLVTYTRGVIPIHRTIVVFRGVNKYYSNYMNGMNFTVIQFSHGKKLWWGWGEEEVVEAGKDIVSCINTNKGKEKYIYYIEKIMKEAIVLSDKMRLLDYKSMSDEELIFNYNKIKDGSMRAFTLANALIDIIDVYPEEALKEMIRGAISNDNNFSQIYSDLTIPICSSFVKEMELELLKLALKIKRGKNEFEKELKQIHDKYWWISIGWENINPKPLSEFQDELNEFLEKDVKKLIEEHEQELVLRKKKKKELIRKYYLPDKIVNLINVFDIWTHLHDVRKEMQMKILNAHYCVMKEASRRKQTSLEDIEWMLDNEFIDFLKTGKYDEKEIEKRKESYLMILINNEIKSWSGKEATRIGQDIFRKDVSDQEEIKGTGVSSGVVKGKAKVCAGVKDALAKVKKGDILICGMTLPDYLPAMKKAAAIVTDEGGITCHAGIVSRELGKPCVVGTKHATNIFKDGDMIEVDADKGVVRKIK